MTSYTYSAVFEALPHCVQLPFGEKLDIGYDRARELFGKTPCSMQGGKWCYNNKKMPKWGLALSRAGFDFYDFYFSSEKDAILFKLECG